jgi:membrane associated rhomboid family serine protease
MMDDEFESGPAGAEGGEARSRAPNRSRPAGEPVFNIPGPILAIAGICVAVQLIRMYLLSPQLDEWVLFYASFIPARLTAPGGFMDPLALLTTVSYSFMHGSLLHVAVNTIWLLAFGSPVVARIGAWRTAVFWVITAVAAALAHLAVYPDSVEPLVGASGSISGMMAAAARYGFQPAMHSRTSAFAGPLLSVRDTLTRRSTFVFIAAWFILNVISGFATLVPGQGGPIAWQAHIGGFVVGFFAIALFDRPHGSRVRGS